MTYLDLLVVGLGVPIVGLLVRLRGDAGHSAGDVERSRGQSAALLAVGALAFLTALPWDASLLHRGTWSYPHGLTLGRLFGVPLEEVLFILAQPVLVGLWLRVLRPPHRPAPATPAARRRLCGRGAGCWLGVTAAGVLLTTSPSTSYLGWLLAWAGPLLALQWAVGGDRLVVAARSIVLGVVPPTLYLCLLDRLALHEALWRLSPRYTTGITVGGLPVEELLFFALTDLLVVGGLLLATDAVTLARVRRGIRSLLDLPSTEPHPR